MKTIIKITEDNFSELSKINKKEDINYLVNELNVFCELKNNDYTNVVEEEKRYLSDKEDYKNSIPISAKGYCQSEWQEYILYYNEKELNTPQLRMYFSSLVEHLERTFTHFNDYFVEKFEQTEIKGKKFNAEPHDNTTFCISHTEFPDKDDILKEYNEIYGEDYDEVLIEVN